MYWAEFWSVPRAPHVSSTTRNWYCLPPPLSPRPPPCSNRSRHLPPTTLVAPSYHQRYDIAPTIVVLTPRCRSCETLMLTSTLVLTVFASRRQPLAEWRCRIHSHVAPDTRCCRCCHHCCLLRVVVVIAATPTIVEPTPPGEPSCRHLPVRRRSRLHPISFLLVVA